MKYILFRLDGKRDKTSPYFSLRKATAKLALLDVPACIIRDNDNKVLVKNYFRKSVDGLNQIVFPREGK